MWLKKCNLLNFHKKLSKKNGIAKKIACGKCCINLIQQPVPEKIFIYKIITVFDKLH